MTVTTRPAMRATIRRRLEDSGATPLWEDGVVDEAIAAAIARYGAHFPVERSTTVAIGAGGTSAVVSPALEWGQVVRVIDPAGQVVPRWREGAAAPAGSAQGWRWWGGALVLAAPAIGGTWRIDYLAPRTTPGDDVTALDLVTGDEEIVALLAAAWLVERRVVEDGKRGFGGDALARQASRFATQAEGLLRARLRRVRSVQAGA